MEPHEWLTEELRHLHHYAQLLREALNDPSVAAGGKNAVAAASKYLVEWEDLIPDTDPLFGYADDLFVIYLALEELLMKGGRAGKAFGARQLPTGRTVHEAIGEAKRRFGAFWQAVSQKVGPGFQHVARAVKQDPGFVEQLVQMLGNYIEAYAAAPRPIQPIDPVSLATFLRNVRTNLSA